MLKSCKEEAGKMERFVLHVPSEHNFKGDPPHWARQLFLEPLIDGWKREVVIRTTPIKNKKADIYYFAPDGTKFRSRREVGQYFLDKGITKYSPVYNFWFCGKILGNEFAPYELVRGVHKKNEGGAGSSTSHLTAEDSPDDLLVTIPESEGKMVSDEEIEIDSEEEMVYDEEIEIDSSQVAVFDPAVLSSRSDPYEPMQLPIVRETYEPRWPGAVKSKEKAKSSPLTIPKKRKLSQKPASDTTTPAKTARRYCICDDVEHGKMVLCDNKNCEIGWYHFKCVNINNSPHGSWYCPICRGPTSDVLNPAYGEKKESC